MSARTCTVVLLFAVSCTTPATAPVSQEQTVVETPRGARIHLPIDVPTERETDGARESFETLDGLVWSVQTIDAGESSLRDVAIALCRRVELGEVEGDLTHRDCMFAGQAAQCIDGWQIGDEGQRITRRGALVRARDEIVWISIAAREGEQAMDSRAEALATETLVETGT